MTNTTTDTVLALQTTTDGWGFEVVRAAYPNGRVDYQLRRLRPCGGKFTLLCSTHLPSVVEAATKLVLVVPA